MHFSEQTVSYYYSFTQTFKFFDRLAAGSRPISSICLSRHSVPVRVFPRAPNSSHGFTVLTELGYGLPAVSTAAAYTVQLPSLAMYPLWIVEEALKQVYSIWLI